jgi:predicted DNA binding CopG/RHH family protein
MEKEMKNVKFPETDSIEELASFWDMHDLTDFEDQLEEVTEVVFERSTETISIPLLPQEIERVKSIAESQGASYTDLIRGWVLEKIHAL